MVVFVFLNLEIENPTQRREGAENAKKPIKNMILFINSVIKLVCLLKQFIYLKNNNNLCALSTSASLR